MSVHREWLKEVLTKDQWAELLSYAREIGMFMYLTPLDPMSLQWCVDLNVPMINLNSGDLTNPIMLRLAGETGKVITLHEIGGTLGEVERALDILISTGNENIVILHSTFESAQSHALMESVNLRVIDTYRTAFDRPVGLVDHSSDPLIPLIGVAYGAVMISKHFMIDTESGFADHTISVETERMSNIVQNIRQVEKSFGRRFNIHDEAFTQDARWRRKTIVAAKNVPAGKTIEWEDLAVKRPANDGLDPSLIAILVGRQIKVSASKDQVISMEMF